jgi:hypothetical protein
MMTSEQIRSDKAASGVRHILLRYWNPLGLQDEDAETTYDGYVEAILNLLKTNPSVPDLVRWLTYLEYHEIGGYKQRKESLMTVADHLLKVNVEK